MKLRLPLPLFQALISATVAACACTAEAAILYSGISIATYTDFGQNMGRYRVYETNALLNYLNQDGVRISYLDGSPDYTLLHGMISFESQNDGGYAAAIGYNFIATVEHNSSFDSTFTSRYIGWDNAIKYSSIEYLEMKSQWTNSDVFALGPEGTDHRISRQSKLITDVAPSTVFRHEGTDVGPATEKMLYRAGSGTMYWMDSAWQMTDYAEPYVFITGGIVTSTGGTWKVDGKEEGFETYTGINWSSAVSGANPMPYAPGSGVGTIYLNAVKEQGKTLTDSFGNSGTLWHGSVTWGEGDAARSVQYNGVQSGLNTWKSLGDYRDKGNWYAYGTDMLALPDTALFYTSNLVFSADAGQHIDINLTGSVDLGVGYLEFRRNAAETDSSPAVFTIASASPEDGTAGDYQLDAAGYVIGAGVEVYLQLKGDAAHVAEWRKTGEGDLHLQGSGENTILLNLGGSGTTYLEYTRGGMLPTTCWRTQEQRWYWLTPGRLSVISPLATAAPRWI